MDKKKKTRMLTLGIYIDKFTGPATGLYLLTHSHRDHTYGLERTLHDVLCTPITYALVPEHQRSHLKPVLIGWQWYTSHHHRFYVIPTIHSPGSCGFYFPDYHMISNHGYNHY